MSDRELQTLSECVINGWVTEVGGPQGWGLTTLGHCPDLEDQLGHSDRYLARGSKPTSQHTHTSSTAGPQGPPTGHVPQSAGGVATPFLPLPTATAARQAPDGVTIFRNGRYTGVHTQPHVPRPVIHTSLPQTAPSRGARQRRGPGLWAGLGWFLEGRGPLAGSCSRGPPPEPHWAGARGMDKKRRPPLAGR